MADYLAPSLQILLLYLSIAGRALARGVFSAKAAYISRGMASTSSWSKGASIDFGRCSCLNVVFRNVNSGPNPEARPKSGESTYFYRERRGSCSCRFTSVFLAPSPYRFPYMSISSFFVSRNRDFMRFLVG